MGRTYREAVAPNHEHTPKDVDAMRMVFTESDQKRDFTLPAEVFIVGRQKQCGLSIRDLSISKEHCECQLVGDVLKIRDLGSRNGTWVNGERIGEQFVECKLSDDLIIGKVPVQLLGAEQAEMAPMQSEPADSEGTMFDPDFGSAVAWNQQQKPVAPAPVGAPAPARPAAMPAAPAAWNAAMAAPAPGGPSLSGQVFEPGLPPTSFALGVGIHFIGTDATCAIHLSSSGVSGSHAKVEHAGGSWYIEDLGSKNGTYVNKQLATRSPLKPGDTVFIGPVRIEMSKPEVAAAAPGMPAAPGAPAPAAAKKSPLKLVVAVFVVLGGLGAAAKFMKKADDAGGGSGSGSGKISEDVQIAQFRNALQLGVAEMEKANYRDASTFLSAANQLKKSTTVESLIHLNSLLAEKPTDNIDKLIEISSTVMKLKDDTWIKTGVIEFTRKTYEKWSKERDNAKYASLGDEQFDKSLYQEALDYYEKLQKDSEFNVVRMGKISTCKAKLTEGLRDEAKVLIKSANPEEAIVKLKAAMVFAPHEMHNELINLLGTAENNKKYAVLLRKGKEEFQNGNFDSAKQFLEQIPDKSLYFKDAAETLEAIKLESDKRDSQKFYQLGEGEKVLALLKAASDPSLVAFREKVDSVHGIYKQAKELYEQEKYKQANDMWETLKRMVGDPTNQYYKWAEAGIKVDPTQLAAEYAKEAQEKFAAGKFLEAAKLNSRALKFDAKNADAVKLRGTIERQVNLRYSIERQKWESGSLDNPSFLKFALEQYVFLRAANAIHPLLAQMAGHIVKAGGEVPPEEKEGEDDPNK